MMLAVYCLAHAKKDKEFAAYQRDLLELRRKLTKEWSDFISVGLTPTLQNLARSKIMHEPERTGQIYKV